MKHTIEELEAAKGWLDDVMFYAVAGGNDKPEDFKRRSHAPKETIYTALTQTLAIAKGDMVVVPREPTGPMIMMGIHAYERNDDLPDIGLGPKSVGIYKAMIGAVK